MKKITLADIAAKTGYSINTVSHALHDKPDISQKTKKYIIKVADEIGYIANNSAGALRSGKTKNIAIILGDISNPHFSILIKEIETQLRLKGYNAFIINTEENQEYEKKAIISAISKGIDGIILCPVQKSKKNIEFLDKQNVPYVLIGRYFDNNSNYVICDDVNSGKIAAMHLFKENRKRILFLNGAMHISSAKERLLGIETAYKEANIPLNLLSVMEVDITNTKNTVDKLLASHNKYDAIICFNDLIALQVCHFLNKNNKSVPEEISVIGFDDIASKFYFTPMLSSVTSSKRNMSQLAVGILMDILSGKNNAPSNIVLETRLVHRDTTNLV